MQAKHVDANAQMNGSAHADHTYRRDKKGVFVPRSSFIILKTVNLKSEIRVIATQRSWAINTPPKSRDYTLPPRITLALADSSEFIR